MRWPQLAGTLLSAYALVGGLISFLGWALDVPRLTDWNNSGISIQPNAALAVVAASASILLWRYGYSWLVTVLGALVWAIGLSTAFQIVSGIHLGINTLLMFDRQWGRGGLLVPGQMGTPAAISYTVIGISIVLISVYRRENFREYAKRIALTAASLALVALTISALSITGYLFGAKPLYTLPTLTLIAFQTATFIFAISFALLSSITEAGPMRIMVEDSVAGVMVRHSTPVIVLIPILLGFLRLAGEDAGLYNNAFGTSAKTLLEIATLLILLWFTANSVSIQSQRTTRATTALQASEERRKLAQAAGNVGIWDWNITTDKTYWSENMWSFYGETPSDINPDEPYWTAHLHNSDRERVKFKIQSVFATHEPKYFDEFRIVRPDRSVRWLESRAEITYDSTLTPTRMYGVTLDITDRKDIEERIKVNQNQLRLVTDSVPALISYVDTDLRFRFVNKKYSDWFGITEDEIIGREIADVLGSVAFAKVKDSIDLVLTGRETSFEVELEFENTGDRYVRMSFVPDNDLDERVVGFYALISDLSDLKHTQDQLRQAHDELEIRVQDRTKELAEAINALVQEMKDREISERQRIELLRRVVSGQETERRRIARDLHDHLGQRLTALRLKLASLNEISDDKEQLTIRIARLQEIAERLDSEVSFLAWELRPSTLDDLGLLEALRAFVIEWSKHSEIPAAFHSAGLSSNRLDRETETHLYRITQEALNNIAKHADAKNVAVMLEKRSDDVILIVEDDGIGFEAGQETDPNDATKGLGLLGMSERASLFGGNLEIESAPGSGTTIYVRVPFSE